MLVDSIIRLFGKEFLASYIASFIEKGNMHELIVGDGPKNLL